MHTVKLKVFGVKCSVVGLVGGACAAGLVSAAAPALCNGCDSSAPVAIAT